MRTQTLGRFFCVFHLLLNVPVNTHGHDGSFAVEIDIKKSINQTNNFCNKMQVYIERISLMCERP